MTGDECKDKCEDDSNLDPHGRRCVAYEHSSKSPSNWAKCALAWACESVKHWSGGSTYKRIGITLFVDTKYV